MKALLGKAGQGTKLSSRAQDQLDQLVSDRNEVIISMFLPTYQSIFFAHPSAAASL
ncbi:MAG: hypothetical protein WAN46_00800 [Gammaproteobacteria bacterium]